MGGTHPGQRARHAVRVRLPHTATHTPHRQAQRHAVPPLPRNLRLPHTPGPGPTPGPGARPTHYPGRAYSCLAHGTRCPLPISPPRASGGTPR